MATDGLTQDLALRSLTIATITALTAPALYRGQTALELPRTLSGWPAGDAELLPVPPAIFFLVVSGWLARLSQTAATPTAARLQSLYQTAGEVAKAPPHTHKLPKHISLLESSLSFLKATAAAGAELRTLLVTIAP
jgi:hypothetical protein